jgi:electron transport complex protein RnfE
VSEPRTLTAEAVKGLWRENPVFVAVLGLCPAMAVTNSLENGLVMGAATAFVLIGASLMVSLLRRVIARAVRISVYIIIIATFVTVVDFMLAALMPEQHEKLGAFISLIVANCLILGRQEAFASRNSLAPSLADACGMAAGFTLSLAMIGGVREVLGSGSLLGFDLFGKNFEPWSIMILPPGGFLTLGALLVFFAWGREILERRRLADGEGASSS